MPVHRLPVRGRIQSLTAACLIVAGFLAGGAPAAGASAPVPAAPPPAPTNQASAFIRVGLAREADALELGASGAYELLDLASGMAIFRGRGDRSARVAAAAGALAVNGAPLPAKAFRLRPLEGAFASLNGRAYRGEIEVRPWNGRLQAVNVVDLEDYLLGVVPREMPPSWHPEALKAQAVAARTYAFYQMREGKFRAEGFDVVDTVESQVYGGVAAEDPRSSAAVRQTRGQVAVFGGQPILAYFHSSSGGHTEHAENVWGKALPYIRGVPDFDQNSPRYRWQRRFSGEEIGAAFAAAGRPVGRVLNLEPDGPQGVSGRWTRLRVVGTEASLSLPATEVRKLLGLDSTLFEIVPIAPVAEERARPLEPVRDVVAVGADGRRVASPPGRMWAVGAGGGARPLAELAGGPRVVVRATVAAGVELRGRGYGHGTGLSQWGAKAMAESGASYDQIIGYYYRGVAVGPGTSVMATR